jgi:hypothetical protein
MSLDIGHASAFPEQPVPTGLVSTEGKQCLFNIFRGGLVFVASVFTRSVA